MTQSTNYEKGRKKCIQNPDYHIDRLPKCNLIITTQLTCWKINGTSGKKQLQTQQCTRSKNPPKLVAHVEILLVTLSNPTRGQIYEIKKGGKHLKITTAAAV